jgi:Ca2+ transporting ATPase
MKSIFLQEFATSKNVLSYSAMFIGIVLMITILQAIIVTFGGIAFSCYTYYGLQLPQWLICIAFGFGGWLVSVLLKFIPEDKVLILN